MGLRDLLKKKANLEERDTDAETISKLASPEFTFIRSDTFSSEVIHPPSHPAHDGEDDTHLRTKEKDSGNAAKNRLSLDVFRSSRSRSSSVTSTKSQTKDLRDRESASKRLSHRLHLNRNPASSEVVPQNLPAIVAYTPDGQEDKEGTELQWEKRATILARENEKHRSRPDSPVRSTSDYDSGSAVVSTKAIDEDIQEAIRLHEEGELEQSTAMFGRLADPKGANNPLSQVLYGLALRHGWGCTPDPAGAVNYLSAAASNAATVENLALQAGLKKGGAAKGELVLAIFELANCFRHGWGIPKDPVAAKQYYETAANLGDTDAMNEVAWCYLEGFGTKKDKYAAAKYYRLAEQNGNKTLGNSWIWKDKYTPGSGKK
ncbi:putative cell cycle inhibitor Nif1 [Coniochaeta ligniaria NRRL 30616]|uniref:Putative cell cycle inhibitor Nif1 n=1 Tax=Coniochaeta ligniaria NRRL 30616 TaxID=1408157 RepID=A0A1J7JZP3_9PEZI|nr:putative cell cycle inhibitor Nif1 [Coniochaeta ligniaria NRRL 30616]